MRLIPVSLEYSHQIVFAGRKTKKSQSHIWLADVDGKNLRKITHTDAYHLAPNWSSDGKSIVYTSYESGNLIFIK